MTPNSFQFSYVNGTYNSVDDWGIKVIKHDFFAPEKRQNKRQIPHVNGAYNAGGLYYNERVLRVDCVWISDVTRLMVRKIAGLLKYRGSIQFSDEADDVLDTNGQYVKRALYYNGEMFDAPELATYQGEKGRRFEIAFSCYPFALGALDPIPVTDGVNHIPYKGTYETPFILTLDNVSGAAVSDITITTIKKEV